MSLDLTPGAAHRELVNHRSEVRKDALRGSAGDPDHGFLLDELAGRLQHDEGKRMPLDADTGVPLEPSPITLAFIDTALVPWIRAGAKDD